MFCPRCGRPVSRTANFCGGCGLPKSEIERMTQPQPEIKVQPVNREEIADIDATLSQLEGDLTGINPVVDYTTDAATNTNTADNLSENKDEIVLQLEDITVKTDVSEKPAGQSEYSANAPVHPMYERQNFQSAAYEDRFAVQPQQPGEKDQNLSTVDFVWMLLISGLPVIGLVYLIYQGFVQQENVNRRSWARATMLISLFAFVLAMVFFTGLFMTQLLYW